MLIRNFFLQGLARENQRGESRTGHIPGSPTPVPVVEAPGVNLDAFKADLGILGRHDHGRASPVAFPGLAGLLYPSGIEFLPVAIDQLDLAVPLVDIRWIHHRDPLRDLRALLLLAEDEVIHDLQPDLPVDRNIPLHPDSQAQHGELRIGVVEAILRGAVIPASASRHLNIRQVLDRLFQVRPIQLADAGVILEKHPHLGGREDQEILLNLGDGRVQGEDVTGKGIGVLALGQPAEEVVEIALHHRMVDADSGDDQGVGLESDLPLGPGADRLGLHLADEVIGAGIDGRSDRIVSMQTGSPHRRKTGTNEQNESGRKTDFLV